MFQHLVVILSVLATLSTGAPRKGRIYGGQDATSGQFPFIVAINDPNQWCDGTIIAPNWILTGAQCVQFLSPTAQIYVGSHLNQVNGTAYTIVERIIHSEFDDWSYQNDIGLLRIDGTLEFGDTIQQIEFGSTPAPNATCTVLGWGTTETEIYPDNLKYVDVTVIDSETCQTLAADYADEGYYLGAEQVCTLGASGMGACYGDAGGPLVCDGQLVGIVSYTVGYDCGAELPDVHTSIDAYVEWIQAHAT